MPSKPSQATASLTKPLERHLTAGHPWVYRDALTPTSLPPGRVTTLNDRKGRFLARGMSDSGPIAFRAWTLRDIALDAPLVRQRFNAALALRLRGIPPDTSAYRLIHGEGDRMPGVVCDRYGPFLVFKPDGEGAAALRDMLLAAAEEAGFSDVLGRFGRGEKKRIERWSGHREIPETLWVNECGMQLPVNLQLGQKTGLFLDHRDSRARVRALANGMSVLNLYGYTGGFSIAAGLGGATTVTTVDVAGPALALAELGFAENGLSRDRHRTATQDVFAFLSEKSDQHYDLIIADPPSFAPNARTLDKALHSYQQLHKSCLSRLGPGGYYLAASCSSHISEQAFVDTVLAAARDLRGQASPRNEPKERAARKSRGKERPPPVQLQCLARWGAGIDHPTLPAFPEGNYLKACLFRVL